MFIFYKDEECFMGQIISRKSFFQQGLAVAVTALMMTSANAASDAEVKQLREEVQALKALVQQQQQIQQQQQVILADVKVQPAVITPLAGLKSKNGADYEKDITVDEKYGIKVNF